MGVRADRKKQAKKIDVGDLVTWGKKVVNERVKEVRSDGVIVGDGYFVSFDKWEIEIVSKAGST